MTSRPPYRSLVSIKTFALVYKLGTTSFSKETIGLCCVLVLVSAELRLRRKSVSPLAGLQGDRLSAHLRREPEFHHKYV